MSETKAAAPLMRPIITNLGFAAASQAATLGVPVKITKVGLTATGGTGAATDTSLPGAVKVDIADGKVISDFQVNVSALLPDTFPSMEVKGIGFYLADGTLFSTYRNTETIISHTGGTTLLIGMDFVMSDIPPESVTVESTGANLVLGDWVPVQRRVNGKGLNVDIILNANDVNAAPSGFGLGTNAPSLGAASCNDAQLTGWYGINNATTETPKGTGPSGCTMQVVRWGGNAIHQVFYDYTVDRTHTRRCVNGVWQDWVMMYNTANPPPAVDLSGYVPKTRKVNNKALDADITLTPDDVGAAPSNHSHSNYVPTTRAVNGKALSSDINLTAADVGAVSKTGDTMLGPLSMGSAAAKLEMNSSAIIGANNSVFMRDFGNGNVVLSGGLNSEGVAGALYLGYRGTLSGTAGYNTSNVRLNAPLVNAASGVLVSEGGLINSELLEGPIRTELDENNIRHTIVGGTDTRNRGRTLIAAGECGAEIAANTSSGQESVHIAGDGNDGVYVHTGVTDWGSATHKITKFQAGEIYVGNGDSRVYHQGFKPTAGDVGAFPITGGKLNGHIETTSGITSGKNLVSNSNVAMMEMLIPGKFANMMYTDAGGGNLRFSKSDGAGAELVTYANFHQSALTFYRNAGFAGTVHADGLVNSNSILRSTCEYPMVELHSPGKSAYAMYAEPSDGTLRLIQTNGSGSVAGVVATFSSVGSLTVPGVLSAGSGAALLLANGMVTGPVWGGDSTIATWCRTNFHPLITAAYQIGSHILGNVQPQSGINAVTPGSHVAGANIHPAGVAEYSENRGITLPGTWMAMGAFSAANNDDKWDDRTTLFMRIM